MTQLFWQTLDTNAGRVRIALDGDGVTVGNVCDVEQTAGGARLVAFELKGAVDTATISSFDPRDASDVTDADAVTLVAWRLLHGTSNDLMCAVERGNMSTTARISLSDALVNGTYALSVNGATLGASSLLVLTSPAPKTP
jgi:hypothetical protein